MTFFDTKISKIPPIFFKGGQSNLPYLLPGGSKFGFQSRGFSIGRDSGSEEGPYLEYSYVSVWAAFQKLILQTIPEFGM